MLSLQSVCPWRGSALVGHRLLAHQYKTSMTSQQCKEGKKHTAKPDIPVLYPSLSISGTWYGTFCPYFRYCISPRGGKNSSLDSTQAVSAHTYEKGTHTRTATCCSEQLEVRCLAQGHFSRGHGGKGERCSYTSHTHTLSCLSGKSNRRPFQSQTLFLQATAAPVLRFDSNITSSSWRIRVIYAPPSRRVIRWADDYVTAQVYYKCLMKGSQ